VVDGSDTLAANLTIPSTLTLKIPQGGMIVKASTYTLVINGPTEIGLYQVFSGFDAGDVTFGYNLKVSNLWWGSALTDIPVQCAISSIDSTLGGWADISAGTFVIGTGLHSYGKSNIKITGAGKDITILEGTVGVMTAPTPIPSPDGNWGVLSIDAAVGLASPAQNILVEDLTIKLNGGTPGSFAADVANGTYWVKTLHFGYCQKIYFNRIKINGSRWEAHYTDGGSTVSASNIRVTNSDYVNTQHNGFNVNTGDAFDVTVINNFFDTCAFGVQVVGRRINISNNLFKDIKSIAINVDEATYPASRATASTTSVIGNIIVGLGKNATGSVIGITVTSGDSQFTDDSICHSLLVQNNSISDSIKSSSAVGSLTGIKIRGSAKVSNNHVSGLTKEAGWTGDSVAYWLMEGTSSGAVKQQVYFENNTLDSLLGQTAWTRGIEIKGVTGSYFYLSGNVITEAAALSYALFVSPTSGTPVVYLNGDILNGYISYPTPGKWSLGGNALNLTGKLNNKPLSGASTGSLVTGNSRGVTFQDTVNLDTTPSVLGHNLIYCANTGATTITNFDDGVLGQHITILFVDSNTTISDGGNFKLSANFSSTADDVLVLFFDGVTWYEVSRSVN